METSFIDKLKEIAHFPLFEINQTPISVFSIAVFLLILLAFYILAKLIKSRVLKYILRKINIDKGLQFTFLRITHYIIVFIGVVIAFQFIGIDLSGLAVILGFLSVGIGFGLQNITSNFIAGLILLFERPIKVGDRVTVGDTEGDVLEINIRSTTVRSLKNISIIVPNSEFISNSVINWSHGDEKIRLDIDVGVSYDSELDLVLKVLKEVAENNKEVLKDPPPRVLFMEFGDSSWNLRIRAWIANPKRYYYVISDVNCEIVRKFRENNIEIPYPQRDLHIRSDNTK
jgi:small-conductance mechanosensitive channel